MNSSIWWIRRDLRLHDNPTLHAAMSNDRQVVPLFILDPHILALFAKSHKRLGFLFAALTSLDNDLRKIGSQLIVRQGKPHKIIPQLITEIEASAVYATQDSSPYAKQRDKKVQANLPTSVPIHFIEGVAIRPADAVQKNTGGPYTVFTPYKKKWLATRLPRTADLLATPPKINSPHNINSDPLPEIPHTTEEHFPATEAAALKKLAAFIKGPIGNYAKGRDFMADDGTSSLSPYLRFGMLSARQAAVEALNIMSTAANINTREGAEIWLSELIWRDFYHQIQANFPHVQRGSFRPVYDNIKWLNDQDDFQAWCDGRTGYPVVDAAMRQLNQTGWMHNRARMIVASFLIKDLLIDWRWGEKYFMQQLVDGDPAANNGGWQWAAGCGTDAAPYFRIFNPISQSKKFDSSARYIRRWVPELAAVEDRYIHAPWEMPPLEQRRIGCIIGQQYPQPIIDHKFARQRTLDAYKVVKKKS